MSHSAGRHLRAVSRLGGGHDWHSGAMLPEVRVSTLIVDDDIDMRTLVRVILEAANRGIDVVAEAVDGVDALAVFERLDPPPVPTVVILDNRMPGMTGLDVAREIRRRLPGQRIILFSAFVTPEIRAEAREIGIDACLDKGDYMRLPDLVMELVGEGERDGTPTGGAMTGDVAQERASSIDVSLQALSHELLTPLTAVTGFSALLTDRYGPALPEGALDLARRIHTSARQRGAPGQ